MNNMTNFNLYCYASLITENYKVTIRPLTAGEVVPYKVTKYRRTKAFKNVVRGG